MFRGAVFFRTRCTRYITSKSKVNNFIDKTTAKAFVQTVICSFGTGYTHGAAIRYY